MKLLIGACLVLAGAALGASAIMLHNSDMGMIAYNMGFFGGGLMGYSQAVRS